MKKIGVLTSGGDAPGMNACIRAIVRAGLAHNLHTIGFRRGYQGLVNGEADHLTSRAVGGIARWGGTILQTARCKEFMTPDGFAKAVQTLKQLEVEGLIVIGGDGSLRGARELHNAGIRCVGIPASIDNDIACTDMAIGVDTALNTILEAIDKIKDTASAHGRAFVIEVMGRHSGYLAYAAGVAGGAEMVIAPEQPTSLERILDEIEIAHTRGKPHFIVVVAEGAVPKADEICDALNSDEHPGYEARLTVLGHVQRGGSPTVYDRLLATRLGARAVELLLDGQSGVMVGIHAGECITEQLEKVLESPRAVEKELISLENLIAL